MPTEMNSHPPTSRPGRGGLGWLLLIALVAGAVVAALLWTRSHEHDKLVETTLRMSASTVSVVSPVAGPTQTEIVLPGNLMAFSEAPIYARTSGYLKSWSTDIGARVKEGEVMAEIDAPDLDAQLRQGTATLAQAKAQQEIARLNFERNKDLVTRKVVSQAEFDQNRTTLESQAAAAQASEAMLQNLNAQAGFKRIVAPFEGVVTKRNTDVGALINGSGNAMTGGQELFRIARTDILRAYVYVPQVYSGAVQEGSPAYLEFAERPGKRFEGKVSHIAGAIDPASRTLLTEVQIPNADGSLFPGAFVSVHLNLTLKDSAVVIPVNTMLFRAQGTQVGVVNEQGVVHLKNVKVGHDFGTTVEIVEGLDERDRLVLNPSDSLAEGQKVEVQKPAAAK